MNRIQRLSDSLITKIAAGEVVERPASVVKELVENAIDAGAKNIAVEIEEGGRKLIQVVDDGCGMNREEVLLAIERHATSKIQKEEDLFKIATLGFRGEALPAIAAVSWMVIETGVGPEATRLEIEGGKILKVGTGARNRGTSVFVRNLFFNTPVRLKFLKSHETEFSHLSNLLEALALSHPEIGFSLRHRGGLPEVRTELQSPSRKGYRERIRDLRGSLESSLRPVSAGRGGLELVGFVSDHQVTSATARSLYFFVNGRPVRDRTLQHAVMSAYENLLMKHRYPWVFLYVTVPPDFVDVNVHPTKSEVRFSQGQLVHDLVREGVRRSLRTISGAGDSGRAPGRADSSEHGWAEPEAGPAPQMAITPPLPPLTLRGGLASDLKVLGQVHGTYLLCETSEKLILIDQHAAHERIGFEKLKQQFESGGVARQALLIPQTFELKPSEAEILKMYLEDLERFGLELEPFGPASFILRAVPALLAGEDCVGLITNLLDHLQSFGKLSPLEEKIHEVLETIACHRQVRAGDRLSPTEIQALLQEMESINFSYSCPHGRPAVVTIPFSEIEKWFRRRL